MGYWSAINYQPGGDFVSPGHLARSSASPIDFLATVVRFFGGCPEGCVLLGDVLFNDVI